MAVLIETSRGDLVIDLYLDDCPKTCVNFLKLCKIKYYNNCIFHNVQPGFIVQTGDPEGTGRGGSSIFGVMYGDQARLFEDEICPKLKHKRKGMVGMASGGQNMNGSQFYITVGENLDSLDEKHTLFGEVAEGIDVAVDISNAYCDDSGRPFQNIRIKHTIVLDDPTKDPEMLAEHIPEASPEPALDEGGRLEDDWVPEEDVRPPEEVEEEVRRREAHNRAVVLEMVGDIPDADVKPPSDMLFVCKLNPVTSEEDLEILFSRFGKITSCDIIRDWKTDDSLCYGFIGFDTDEACEAAYFKMNNVIIDDRRIKVDFSQSVYHLWRQFRRFGKKGKGGAPNSGKPNPDDVKNKMTGMERVELKSRHQDGNDDYQLLLDEPEEPMEGRRGAREGDRTFEKHDRKGRKYEEDRNRSRNLDRRSHRESSHHRRSQSPHRSRGRSRRDHRERSRSRGRRDYDDRSSPKYGRQDSRDRGSHRRESGYRRYHTHGERGSPRVRHERRRETSRRYQQDRH